MNSSPKVKNLFPKRLAGCDTQSALLPPGSYPERRRSRARGFGGLGSKNPHPPSTLNVNCPGEAGEIPAEKTLYSAYVPSTDLTLNKTLISGMGSKTSDSCGESVYKKMIICSVDSSHDYYQVGGSSCGDPSCPVCWSQWAHRGADRISCRVEGFQQFTRHPPRHIILSLDPALYDFVALGEMEQKKGHEYLKKEFRKLSDAYGITGGAMVIHLYRTTDEVPRDIPSVKKWQWVRDQGPVRFHDLTVFEPHAHVAGYGYLVEPKEGEFLYKNKGPLKTRDDLERWAYYTLSHASIIEDKKSVTYFGTCAYNKLKHTWMIRFSVNLRCEICGAPMVYEDNPIEGFYIKRTMADWVYSEFGFDKTKNPLSPGKLVLKNEK